MLQRVVHVRLCAQQRGAALVGRVEDGEERRGPLRGAVAVGARPRAAAAAIGVVAAVAGEHQRGEALLVVGAEEAHGLGERDDAVVVLVEPREDGLDRLLELALDQPDRRLERLAHLERARATLECHETAYVMPCTVYPPHSSETTPPYNPAGMAAWIATSGSITLRNGTLKRTTTRHLDLVSLFGFQTVPPRDPCRQTR